MSVADTKTYMVTSFEAARLIKETYIAVFMFTAISNRGH